MTTTVQANNISRKITSGYVQTSDAISYWESIIDVLKAKHITEVKEISPVLAEKYQFDMYGLFQELGVPDSHIYPHIRVNDYASTNDYYGEKLRISMLDQYTLELYISRFLQR